MGTQLEFNFPSIRKYILAGKSTFTVRSLKTGKHFTFKCEGDKKGPRHYISVLTGPENTSNFTFLGTVFNNSKFVHGKKSRIFSNSPSAMAFGWFWENADNLPKTAEFLKSCKCCRCGRELTTPESINAGIGPECSKMV